MPDKRNEKSFSVTATGNYELGGSPDNGLPCLFIIGWEDGGGANMSVVPKARSRGSMMAYVAIPYKKRNLAGAADDSTVNTAIVAVNGIIEVNAAGLDLSLDITRTAGTLNFFIDKVTG